MDYFDEMIKSGSNASYLTGIILGTVKYREGDDVSNRAKEFLLERLIYTHTTYPIGNSENFLKEATELLKTFQK